MTHAELVARAQRWLRNTRKHSPVLAEIGSSGYECPDVIGWARGWSTLVECKVSRSDFLADGAKAFRRNPASGMGLFRWYAIPLDLFERSQVIPLDLPERWGLVAFGARGGRVLRTPEQFPQHALLSETHLLVSAIKRATKGWGRKVFGDISPVFGQLDPHPSVAATLKIYRETAAIACRQRDELNDVISKRDQLIELLERELGALRAATTAASSAHADGTNRALAPR